MGQKMIQNIYRKWKRIRELKEENKNKKVNEAS
jgi:hypothetical protein